MREGLRGDMNTFHVLWRNNHFHTMAPITRTAHFQINFLPLGNLRVPENLVPVVTLVAPGADDRWANARLAGIARTPEDNMDEQARDLAFRSSTANRHFRRSVEVYP